MSDCLYCTEIVFSSIAIVFNGNVSWEIPMSFKFFVIIYFQSVAWKWTFHSITQVESIQTTLKYWVDYSHPLTKSIEKINYTHRIIKGIPPGPIE